MGRLENWKIYVSENNAKIPKIPVAENNDFLNHVSEPDKLMLKDYDRYIRTSCQGT